METTLRAIAGSHALLLILGMVISAGAWALVKADKIDQAATVTQVHDSVAALRDSIHALRYDMNTADADQQREMAQDRALLLHIDSVMNQTAARTTAIYCAQVPAAIVKACR